MKHSRLEPTVRLAALAVALTSSGWAQSAQNSAVAPSTPPNAEPAYGLLGDNYFEVDATYQNNAATPGVFHDYGIVSNENIEKGGNWGIDGNFDYDFLSGGAFGHHDYRNEAEVGVTTFLMESWGKPFLNGGAGWAWEHNGGQAGSSFAYSGTAGVEFQIINSLVITPFVEYSAEPNLNIGSAVEGDLPNHLWDTGAKATYRFTPQLSASLGMDVDQHKASDLGYKAGLAFHF